MAPTDGSDTWFFVSQTELDQQQAAAEKKSKSNRKGMKEIIEVGVGSKWVPAGPEDFLEVSWEDALLPEKSEDETAEKEKEELKGVDAISEPENVAAPTVLHPAKESPWATMTYKKAVIKPFKESNNIGGKGRKGR